MDSHPSIDEVELEGIPSSYLMSRLQGRNTIGCRFARLEEAPRKIVVHEIPATKREEDLVVVPELVARSKWSTSPDLEGQTEPIREDP